MSNIIVSDLRVIPTENGSVRHVIRNEEMDFRGFGEAYFTSISQGSVRAWKRHRNMTMNLVVPVGRVGFAFLKSDESVGGAIEYVTIGVLDYKRITVPPGIWFGFKGLGSTENLILNISNVLHEIPFDWTLLA